MGIQLDDITLRSLRGVGVRLLLAAMLLRALIPAGFMPDVSGLAKGELKVVICSAQGAHVVTLDDSGMPDDDGATAHHDHPCAFTGLAHIVFDLAGGLTLPAFEFAHGATLRPLAVVLPPSRAGPPLGSRGPPQLS